MEEFSAEICLRKIRRLEKEIKELRTFKEFFLLGVAKYIFNDCKYQEGQALIKRYIADLPLDRKKLYKYIQKKEKEL